MTSVLLNQWVAVAATVLAVACAAESPSGHRQGGAMTEWPLAGGDLLNMRYSTLHQIDTSNVDRLGGAWVTTLPAASSRAAALVQDGTLYLTGGINLFALDAKTGAIKWKYASDRGAFSSMGAAVGEGLVFAGVSERLAAIRQTDGTLAWMYEPPDDPAQRISAPPSYSNGMVIAPVSGGDSQLRGRIVALDAEDGHELWRFDVVPGPGEAGHDTWPQDSDAWRYGGGAVWMVPAADPELGLVYLATGNAAPPWGGAIRQGDNLFTNSIVALDVKTGALRWHFQLIHHDIWEYDLSTPVVLYDAVVDGRIRKVVAVMRPDGYLFLLDRKTGDAVNPVEERPVPQDAVLGTAPTQPFPVAADRLGPDCVPEDAVPPGFELGCYFEPIRADMPNYARPGVARFAPLAYSPSTGFLYAAGCATTLWVRPTEDPRIMNGTYDQIPGAKRQGMIAAFDGRTNRIVWRKELSYPMCRGGGPLATAGGLVFFPEPDGNMRAYDAATGDVVWQFQTGVLPPTSPSGPYDGPLASYEIDGEQMIAGAVGREVWAFKIDGPLEPRPAPGSQPDHEPFAGVPQDTLTIQTTTTYVQTVPHRDYRGEWTHEFALDPVQARVKKGMPIAWSNTGSLSHRFAARDGSWGTETIPPGQSATIRVETAGTYDYICTEHPWTIGRLIVE